MCRHIVFPNLDHRPEFDWVPDEGEVKVSDSIFYLGSCIITNVNVQAKMHLEECSGRVLDSRSWD